MKKVTMADIAKETGYSINTVSHALKGKTDISKPTRELIRKVADELGYIGNASASYLRSGKSNTIALVLGDISNPHFSVMAKEMEGKLREYGYTAFVLNTDEDEAREKEAIVLALGKNVDGIIICPCQKSRDNIEFMRRAEVPYVLIGRKFEDKEDDYVVCDDKNGGYCAAKQLISEGHKKILFINGDDCISSARERLEGVRLAIKESGLGEENLCVESVPAVTFTDTLLMKELLLKNADCTGIIAFSDLVAMQVCHVAKSIGKNVPEDLSVIGFDDIVSKFCLPVMLSSVTSSKTKMSLKATEILMEKISDENAAVSQVVLPTHVVLRETTKKITGRS